MLNVLWDGPWIYKGKKKKKVEDSEYSRRKNTNLPV